MGYHRTSDRIQRVWKLFEAFMSPGSVTEKLYFLIVDDDSLKTGKGGGLEKVSTAEQRLSRRYQRGIRPRAA